VRIAWIACGVLGLALLVPFESALPVAAGVVLLLPFVALGVWTIASPAFLRADAGEDEPST